MKIYNTYFKDLKIIKHKRFVDTRGSLRETFIKKKITFDRFVFDYTTISKKNIFRGFHFQYKNQQSKLVTVIKGKILDCVMDLRKESKTFGKTYSVILSEDNCKSLYVPRGFAHGYLSMKKLNVIQYKLSNYYFPQFEDGINFKDNKTLNKKISKFKIRISKKDKLLGDFEEFKKKYKSL